MTNDDTVHELDRRAWDHAVVPDADPVWARDQKPAALSSLIVRLNWTTCIDTGQSRAMDRCCRAAALSGYVPRYLRHRALSLA